MLELILILVIYTVIVLLLVPLEKIGRWQTSLKNEVKKLSDRVNK